MIAPILEAFPPKQYRQGQTQILLGLNGEAQVNNINEELEDVLPQLLLFLRKLSTLRVRTPSRRVRFSTEKRECDPDFAGGETIIINTLRKVNSRLKKEFHKYFVLRHTLQHLPKDERRSGVEESEIVLAFLVSENKPVIEEQSVYAYLPVDDYGFAVSCHIALARYNYSD